MPASPKRQAATKRSASPAPASPKKKPAVALPKKKTQLITKKREKRILSWPWMYAYSTLLPYGVYMFLASAAIVQANKKTDEILTGHKNLELFPIIGAGIIVFSLGLADILELKYGDGEYYGFPAISLFASPCILAWLRWKVELLPKLAERYWMWNQEVLYWGAIVVIAHNALVLMTSRYRNSVKVDWRRLFPAKEVVPVEKKEN